MNAGSRIVVQTNKSVAFYYSSLIGCDYLWQGIDFDANAKCVFYSSFISDARFALNYGPTAGNNGLSVQNSSFHDNVIGIRISETAGDVYLTSLFRNNQFRGTRPLLSTPPGVIPAWTSTGDFAYAGMVVWNSHMNLGTAFQDPTLSNIFENMYSGVNFYDNHVTIKESIFRNIPGDAANNNTDIGNNINAVQSTALFSGSTSPETGLGYLSVNGFGKYSTIMFSDNDHAIRAIGSRCYVDNVHMYDNQASIWIQWLRYFPAVQDAFVIIDNFIEESFLHFGVSVAGCQGITGHISRNEIQHAGWVIYENIHLSSNDAVIEVSNNEIYNNGYAGIHVKNSNNTIVVNNNLWLKDHSLVNYGIISQSSDNCNFSCNEVTYYGNAVTGVGLRINDSWEGVYKCNETHDLYQGIQFFAANPFTDLKTNMISNCDYGLYYHDNSESGSQIDKGNTFGGSLDYGAYHDGGVPIAQFSKYWVESTTTPDYPIGTIAPITPVPGPSFKWFDISGNTRPECDTTGCNIYGLIADDPEQYIDRDPGTNSVLIYTAYQTHSALFSYLSRNPSLLTSGSRLDSFYQANLNSDVGLSSEIRDSIGTLSELTSTESMALVGYLQAVGQLQWLIDSLDALNQPLQDTFGFTDQQYRNQLWHQMDSVYLLADSVKSLISQRVKTKADQLWQKNDSLSPSHICAQKEKDAFGILLKIRSEGRAAPDSGEIIQLKLIAGLCQYEYGRGVVTARGLLASAGDTTVYDDDVLCVPPPTVVKEAEVFDALSVTPNPTNGNCQINIPEDGTLSIISVRGLELMQYTVEKGLQKLDLGYLPEGLYFIQWKSETKTAVARCIISR